MKNIFYYWKMLLSKKKKCKNKKCNYNTGKNKCILDTCHYKNR